MRQDTVSVDGCCKFANITRDDDGRESARVEFTSHCAHYVLTYDENGVPDGTKAVCQRCGIDL